MSGEQSGRRDYSRRDLDYNYEERRAYSRVHYCVKPGKDSEMEPY